jgi:hypothetical protein
MMNTETSVILRRTITPYIGQSLILVGVTVFLFCIALRKQQLNLLWAAGLIWVLYASFVLLFGMQYKVFLDDQGVTMRASGGPKRNIQFEEITDIRYETASADEFLAQARPFRRIVILGHRHDPNGRIDISLRHFRSEDINALLMAIHKRRPDLKLPGGWPHKV